MLTRSRGTAASSRASMVRARGRRRRDPAAHVLVRAPGRRAPGGEELVGHGKQDFVLSLDVVLEHPDVAPRRRRSFGAGGAAREGAEVASPFLVLFEEEREGTSRALGAHGREQLVFLLAVMAAVGERLQELDEVGQRRVVHGPAGRETVGHPLEHSEGLKDHLVLVAKNRGRRAGFGRGRPVHV
jgi:hypothetical protein